jgi:hypothetical protein
LEIAGNGSKDHVKGFRAPDNLLAERDALAAAREQRALTGYFCGDPPPGFSALNGKTGLRFGRRHAIAALRMTRL